MSSFPLASAGYNKLNLDCFVEEILKLVEPALLLCILRVTRPEGNGNLRHIARTAASCHIDQRANGIPG